MITGRNSNGISSPTRCLTSPAEVNGPPNTVTVNGRNCTRSRKHPRGQPLQPGSGKIRTEALLMSPSHRLVHQPTRQHPQLDPGRFLPQFTLSPMRCHIHRHRGRKTFFPKTAFPSLALRFDVWRFGLSKRVMEASLFYVHFCSCYIESFARRMLV